MMSEIQKGKLEEAKRESEQKTYGVCADGQKHNLKEYDDFSNQINNE